MATITGVTANNTQSGSAAANLIDGNPSTYWEGTTQSNTSFGEITFQLSEAAFPTGFTITASTEYTQTPIAWNITYSQDNVSWYYYAGDEIAAWTSAGQSRAISLPEPPTGATYYRIQFTSRQATTSRMRISGLVLDGLTPKAVTSLPAPPTGYDWYFDYRQALVGGVHPTTNDKVDTFDPQGAFDHATLTVGGTVQTPYVGYQDGYARNNSADGLAAIPINGLTMTPDQEFRLTFKHGNQPPFGNVDGFYLWFRLDSNDTDSTHQSRYRVVYTFDGNVSILYYGPTGTQRVVQGGTALSGYNLKANQLVDAVVRCFTNTDGDVEFFFDIGGFQATIVDNHVDKKLTGRYAYIQNRQQNFLRSPGILTAQVTTPIAITLDGPTEGTEGAALEYTIGTEPPITDSKEYVVTPAATGTGAGSFTPSSVTLNSSNQSDTVDYTASGAGTQTVSVTNDVGLPNPMAIAVEVEDSGGEVEPFTYDFTVATDGGVTPTAGTLVSALDAQDGNTFQDTGTDMGWYSPGVARVLTTGNRKVAPDYSTATSDQKVVWQGVGPAQLGNAGTGTRIDIQMRLASPSSNARYTLSVNFGTGVVECSRYASNGSRTTIGTASWTPFIAPEEREIIPACQTIGGKVYITLDTGVEKLTFIDATATPLLTGNQVRIDHNSINSNYFMAMKSLDVMDYTEAWVVIDAPKVRPNGPNKNNVTLSGLSSESNSVRVQAKDNVTGLALSGFDFADNGLITVVDGSWTVTLEDLPANDRVVFVVWDETTNKTGSANEVVLLPNSHPFEHGEGTTGQNYYNGPYKFNDFARNGGNLRLQTSNGMDQGILPPGYKGNFISWSIGACGVDLEVDVQGRPTKLDPGQRIRTHDVAFRQTHDYVVDDLDTSLFVSDDRYHSYMRPIAVYGEYTLHNDSGSYPARLAGHLHLAPGAKIKLCTTRHTTNIHLKMALGHPGQQTSVELWDGDPDPGVNGSPATYKDANNNDIPYTPGTLIDTYTLTPGAGEIINAQGDVVDMADYDAAFDTLDEAYTWGTLNSNQGLWLRAKADGAGADIRNFQEVIFQEEVTGFQIVGHRYIPSAMQGAYNITAPAGQKWQFSGSGFTSNTYNVTTGIGTVNIADGSGWQTITYRGMGDSPTSVTIDQPPDIAVVKADSTGMISQVWLNDVGPDGSFVQRVRFMDINGANISGPRPILTSADIQPYGSFNGGFSSSPGMPPSEIVEFCNAANVAPRICLPYNAGYTYMTAYMTILRDGLNAHLIPEYVDANELWNTLFYQSDWLARDADENGRTVGAERAVRTQSMIDAAEEVYGTGPTNRAKYRIVLETGLWQGHTMAECEEVLNSGSPALRTKIDGVSPATYWGHTVTPAKVNAVVSTPGVLRQAEIERQLRIAMEEMKDRWIAWLIWLHNYNTANSVNLSLSAYEGQYHNPGGVGNWEVGYRADFDALVASESWYDMQYEMLDFQRGCGGAYYYFIDVGSTAPDNWGKLTIQGYDPETNTTQQFEAHRQIGLEQADAPQDYVLLADTGHYILTGQEADFQLVSGGPQNYVLTAETGHYIVAGYAADLQWVHGTSQHLELQADTGHLQIVGKNVILKKVATSGDWPHGQGQDFALGIGIGIGLKFLGTRR